MSVKGNCVITKGLSPWRAEQQSLMEQLHLYWAKRAGGEQISAKKYGPIWRVTIRYLYTVFLLYLFNK